MQSNSGAAPPKRFSVPTRIKIIDYLMLFWPFLAMLLTFAMINQALRGKYRVQSLTAGRNGADDSKTSKKKKNNAAD